MTYFDSNEEIVDWTASHIKGFDVLSKDALTCGQETQAFNYLKYSKQAEHEYATLPAHMHAFVAFL